MNFTLPMKFDYDIIFNPHEGGHTSTLTNKSL